MKKFTLAAALATGALSGSAMAGFINEFHYDNTGGDVGEFIEVVLEAGESAADFDVYLYNGSGGAQYGSTLNLATDFTFHGVLGDGLAYYSISLPANGLQNGSPDAIGLTAAGSPVELLSYEGTLTGVGGPFDTIMSTDIGTSESSSTPLGSSLQLVGGSWVLTEGFNTQGAINSVPGPAALALLGIAGLAGRRRRRA